MKITGAIKKHKKVMSIDASSRSIAYAIFSPEKQLVDYGKIEFPKGASMSQKLQITSSEIRTICLDHAPDKIVIEQPIYIQNPQTSRILSQLQGHLYGRALDFCDDVSEVTIQKWKSYIGYKNVSKQDKAEWAKTMTASEVNKMAQSERKQRTIRIIHERIPSTKDITDNDICDAIGIGLWAIDN